MEFSFSIVRLTMRGREFMLDKILGLFRRTKHKNDLLTEDEYLKKLDMNKLPKHIAIIMDGNGRWAAKRGLPRGAGHRAGVESLREVVNVCSRFGIEYLTVYAFSTENWKRPKEEVNILMDLLVEYINKEVAELHRKNVRVNSIGRIDQLSQTAQDALSKAYELTKDNTSLTLNIALNYGGRTELIDAMQDISGLVLKGQLKIEEIDEEVVNKHLYTAGIPDPDLLIRPSGEYRLSNYLLWQVAYSEFWMTPVLWPDFRKIHLMDALVSYQKRKRRFGGL